MTERKTGMVRVRNGFSDRNEIAPLNRTMQFEEFDDDTRTKISNKLHYLLKEMLGDSINYFPYHNNLYQLDEIPYLFCKDMLNDVFCERNTIERGRNSYDWRWMLEKIRGVIKDCTYNEVIDIIEYSVNWFENRMKRESRGFLYDSMNELFEQEYVGYRFIRGRIVAITDENEIEAIEKACNNSFEGCRAHIHKALGFLADREKKDYKNSIKESISAVESICQIITNGKEPTLSKALDRLEKAGTQIHPGLKQAFQKLYAYTSDQGGIRHADGMFESNVTFEEAEFMLVACSAFVNYLIAEYGKGGK